MPPLYFRPAKAAEVLSLSRAYVYVLMNRGVLASFKLGKARLIIAESLYSLRDQRNAA